MAIKHFGGCDKTFCTSTAIHRNVVHTSPLNAAHGFQETKAYVAIAYIQYVEEWEWEVFSNIRLVVDGEARRDAGVYHPEHLVRIQREAAQREDTQGL